MLLGVGGSGKQSLTSLAAFISGCKLSQMQLVKGFNAESFKEYLRGLMKVAGLEGRQVVFLFTDVQVLDEGFLEDVNSVLNSGEVPNLWSQEDRDLIISETRAINSKLRRPEDPDSIYKTFVERVRSFLHIVLCMSPVGSSLRVRCRMFPSLVDCCAMVQYSAWPEEALLRVANHIILNAHDFPQPSALRANELAPLVAEQCKIVH